MRRLFVLLGLLALAVQTSAELPFKALSVTDTSQTYYLPRPQEVVGLCNLGANEAYYRLFWDGETPAVATTAYSVLPAGTAGNPFCIGIGTAKTQPSPWRAVSIICAGAETATVHVQSE